MSNAFELSVKIRQDVGKGASRRLRREEDLIPGIIYGSHKDPEMITLEQKHVRKALQNEAFYSHILTLNVEGTKQKVVLKAVQRHPAKPRVMHMDFLRVSATEKITMQVPVHLIGGEESPGVKAGGVVSHPITSIEVSCLPGDLPESINVDISTLELDATVHLSEITPPKGVEFVALSHDDDHDQTIAAIHIPRAVVEEESEAAESEASAEDGKQEDEKTDEAKKDDASDK